MVALANTTLDLCVLEFGLLLRLIALVLGACFPVRYWPENDVLSHGDGICLWAGWLALFLTKLGPLLSFGDTWVYDLLDDGLLDAAGGLDLLAILNTVGDDCFGSILVLDDLVGWERGGGLLVVFFRPVGAATWQSSAYRLLSTVG